MASPYEGKNWQLIVAGCGMPIFPWNHLRIYSVYGWCGVPFVGCCKYCNVCT